MEQVVKVPLILPDFVLCVSMIPNICRSKIDNQVLPLVTSVLQMRKFFKIPMFFYVVIYFSLLQTLAACALPLVFVCQHARSMYIEECKQQSLQKWASNSLRFLCYKMGITVLTLCA